MSILEVIVGTQFGSEGKGHVTAQRVKQLMSNGIEVWNVRVAGPNAGHYPQCTSSNTRATDFLAMAGITPWHQGVELFGVWGATRVYPIRVAGNSGSLKGETSWDELGLDKEYTTVTKKERRVGEWDGPLVRDAVRANGVTQTMLALTMSDQKFPELAGKTGRTTLAELPIDVQHWVQQIEVETNAAVAMVTTGEDTAFYIMPDLEPRPVEDVIEESPAGAEGSDSDDARGDGTSL